MYSNTHDFTEPVYNLLKDFWGGKMGIHDAVAGSSVGFSSAPRPETITRRSVIAQEYTVQFLFQPEIWEQLQVGCTEKWGNPLCNS